VSASGFSQPVAAWLGGPNLGFGDAGKDAVVGPGRTSFNTSVYKSFAFTERARFEFRADSFNHTQFNSLLSTSITSPNGTQDPRVFEFSGKFIF